LLQTDRHLALEPVTYQVNVAHILRIGFGLYALWWIVAPRWRVSQRGMMDVLMCAVGWQDKADRCALVVTSLASWQSLLLLLLLLLLNQR